MQDHPEQTIVELVTETGAEAGALGPDTVAEPDFRALVGFHVAGARTEAGAKAPALADLAPALFAGYRELEKLRHDYPLVLVGDDPQGGYVQSLSGLIDEIIRRIAPRGIEGERLRKHLLRLEAEIRVQVFKGATGTLSKLWGRASKILAAGDERTEAKAFKESAAKGRRALPIDGELIGCDAGAPGKLITHAWTAVEARKARALKERIEALVLKLCGILKADYMNSDDARSAKHLESSVGSSYHAAFDFSAMSRILTDASVAHPLPADRYERVSAALAVLQSQRFVGAGCQCRKSDDGAAPHGFVFRSCERALKAFDERVPEMVALIKACAIAELEIENRYQAAEHDPYFAAFDEAVLAPDDLVAFPSYLVHASGGSETAALIDLLSTRLPIKVLVRSDDILGTPICWPGRSISAATDLQPASLVVGGATAYVLQSSASNLYQKRAQILAGIEHDGPALFSVFTGDAPGTPDLRPYLASAAAMQAHAFPAFTYDPSAGADLASRFAMQDNPQVDLDWPVDRFTYRDRDHQRVMEDLAFTFVDFAACDARYADYFMWVPPNAWHEGMIPVNAYLDLEISGLPDKVPYVPMIDANDVLHKLVVDDRMIEAARRCRESWRSLQELGGINNSHALQLLKRERENWQEEKDRELEALRRETAPVATPDTAQLPAEAPAAGESDPAEAEPVEATPGDEPYIETPRCTTCNECTQINDRMFVYNDDQQAYIADLAAGTYQDLVEAAESCQVAIIHPGKPIKPDEPGLDSLIERAKAFL